uniref:Uncharacterized protein n=1 Tax=Scylla olivacea TaxID=85551 RepID=A0A0P4VRX7_SCYOL
MDLKKAYDMVDREALWDVLKIYCIGGEVLEGIKASYKDASACVRMEGELGGNFVTEKGVNQRCVMSLWLFDIFMNCCMKEIKVGNVGESLKWNGVGLAAVVCLSADCITSRV